ncbi:riboflavin biosynthesis protein RibF [Sodaliphilus pleomorphus]|jgi:riboflavin kinase/FMN adenylyltransferase|uniref:Riboflavin biosynthesis protein n=1 Tax=Sodaliphilus pleomorphus TaxID=2606626 RepID=A0A6L5XEJ6_9BACT|nr:riboflavin biosynthesis protein RibF [Sodaliphilus pleomorphus]MCI6170014.1 riboflavin biosynthesis protein RibF [Muribaculaceae bacterium]MDD6475695.1 riboflavin biosynthesis protein RibF [Sodaliphilus pleomorphus]MDY6258283.1 riboflavin biosynthesis protein RibF [Bacteroidales bacterium]MSS17716.1 riboflavin biosynthesis protein RibF [Sodaliphilus pleomorphus]
MKIIGSDTQLEPGTTIATIGMFDGVHLGHATLLDFLKEQARQRGLESAVVTFAQHPQAVLHPEAGIKMIMTVDDKLKLIARHGIDCTVLLDFTRELSLLDSSRFIELLRDRYGVAALVAGYDHHFGHNKQETFADYVRHGRELGVDIVKAPEYLGAYAPVSSSIIRKLIASGKVDDAMHCMGHPYSLAGKVVHGFHNGSGIGFPTANVGELDPTLILPHRGAYAVMVDVAGKHLKGMVNVGVRPTMHNGHRLSIEVNIFDFDGDIYGMPIKLEFIKFLRLEFKLGSIEELRAQLTRDRAQSVKILDAYCATRHEA